VKRADDTPTNIGEPGERRAAERFGKLVDGMLEGQHAPPAMDADDRALLEAATVLHATLGQPGLAPARRDAAIAAALGGSTGTRTPVRRSSTTAPPVRARRRWLAPAVAAASLVVAAGLSVFLLSRPAEHARVTGLRSVDEVLGQPIGREAAGAASARLDLLLADRLEPRR
jgi:hypothetical protein